MKKFTKFFILILTICLSVSMLNGCVIVPLNGGNVGGLSQINTNVNINIVQSGNLQGDSVVDMLEVTRPTVYEVYAQQANSNSVSCGSGTIIADNISTSENSNEPVTYFILTCHHVIDTTDVYMVKDIYGNEFDAQLIGGDAESDIAVICFTPTLNGYETVEGNPNQYKKGDKTINIAKANVRLEKNEDGTDSNPVRVGERVFAIGNPLGTLGGTVTQGIISSCDREINVEGKTMTLIQTDCAINSGNSGGGLFDVNGSLVGVVNAGYSGDVEGLNFAIPSDDALNIFKQLLSTYTGDNYGYVKGRANFVLSYGNLVGGADIAVYEYADFFDRMVYITGVGAIYNNKFQKNDVIKSVQVPNEKVYAVSSATSLVNYINSKSYKIGDEIIFKVVRSNQEIEVSITLEQYIYKNTGVYTA